MEKHFELHRMEHDMLDHCVVLFMDTFSKKPWYDVYDSTAQVIDFFEHHMHNNYFVGYVLKDGEDIVAISLGMKKPWIKGMEYYIDQFCVKADQQGMGIGSLFLSMISEDIETKGMNALILNTEKGFPSEEFYLKNGFNTLDKLVVLAK